MATNLPFCFFIQFLEQLLKFLVNFTLLKYVKSRRSYGFLITKELIFGFQILDLNSGGGGESVDEWRCAILALEVIPKNLIFA